jgi:hypothetical protein
MAKVIIGRDGPLTYYNYGGETWGDVCGVGGVKDQGKNGFDYDFVFIHKGTIKPFAARHKTQYRWYKVKDDLPDPVNDRQGNPTYVLNNDNIDKNTYIRFYYVDNEEKYTEINELNNNFLSFVCNTMQSKNLKKNQFYYTETFCRDPDSTQCSVQGGKNKHKSYHKRQQRRSKRRQQKSKRIQRK